MFLRLSLRGYRRVCPHAGPTCAVLDSTPIAALDGRRSQEEINALSVSVWQSPQFGQLTQLCFRADPAHTV